jgi:hypothetical protein
MASQASDENQMKRWPFILLAAITVIVAVAFKMGMVPGRPAEPTDQVKAARTGPKEMVRTAFPPNISDPPAPKKSPRTQGMPAVEGQVGYWEAQVQRGIDLQETMLLAKEKEIDEIAGRLRVNASTIEKLKVWNRTALDLDKKIWKEAPPVATEAQYWARMERVKLVWHAQRKAEERLLGGREAASRYFQLMLSARHGYRPDEIDDKTGRLQPPDPPVNTFPVISHVQKEPEKVKDTSEFDSFFN